MLESVSPYALLRASIPRPVSQQASAYDLFSVSQSVPRPTPGAQAAPPIQTPSAARPEPTPQPEPEPQSEPAAQSEPQAAPAMPPSPRIPAKRTHYISDIHSRHTAAVRQTTFVTPQR